MSFQSFHFLLFFVAVVGITYYGVRSNGAKKNLLLVASYYFYMCWDWRFAGLLLFLTVANYYFGAKISEARDVRYKRIFLAASLLSSLGVLAYFKYANFFIDSANDLLTAIGFSNDLPLLSVALPVGISFYTFQSISYTLDIYRDRMTRIDNIRDFGLFVAFFPQLVAGPIVRASYFLPQLEDFHRPDQQQLQEGIALVLRGFIKKIFFADVLARQIVDPAFSSPAEYSPVYLIIALYAYSFQIYMDFSGYTDIARGVAKTLGYELQINFNRPYKAISVSNFWQRWHISMSSFFRDYLFFGLGGSRHGNVYINVFITFVAIGVWHGAGWNFVVYGAIHGSIVAFERWRREQRSAKGLQPIPRYFGFRLVGQWFLILSIVSVARVLFRAGSIEGAIEYCTATLTSAGQALPLSWFGILILSLAIALHYTPDDWAIVWKRKYAELPSVIQASIIVGTIYALIAVSAGSAPFIYFQF
jgi:D-alanyl-lipoteichoic acid acyltransferase DltB (MBOAT superfamily)